ncbi:MAG: hypothetical protein LBT80_00570 [Lactobacillaceae bacterium]|jgi:flagellar biosynthesis/type III secretory pathway M-ring protein FliF/YscJ|nr:hypothetical protein [Lactobacillaceae bacterium]
MWKHFIWISILLIIIIFIIVMTIIRRIGRRQTEKRIIASQQVVNHAMQTVMPDLQANLRLLPIERVNSTLVANIWGHDVMAFEFQFDYVDKIEVAKITEQLSGALTRYADQQHLVSTSTEDAALMPTDVWYDAIKPIVHFDIAYLVNAQTAAYIRDLRLLNQPIQ